MEPGWRRSSFVGPRGHRRSFLLNVEDASTEWGGYSAFSLATIARADFPPESEPYRYSITLESWLRSALSGPAAVSAMQAKTNASAMYSRAAPTSMK